MSLYSNSKVIASIGVSPTVINQTIFSNAAPTTRENGGDLRSGDRWINTITNNESAWDGTTWVALQPPELQNG
jgi:hypothetical protein